MSSYDTVIVGGCVVTPHGEAYLDLGIADGKIAAIETDLGGQGKEEVRADECCVIPGIIDSHVHLNEPGHTEWEGFKTGSSAAVAGGVTCLFDMPLNSVPTTVDVEAFELKRKCGEANCLTDFALWGGLIPGNIDFLEPLHAAGVIGFKAFMSSSGLPEFPSVNNEVLKAGMKKIASLQGMRLALHAEDETLTNELTRRCIESGQTGYGDYMHSRPIQAELLAIRTAIELAGETGCPIQIVHVSCPEGINLVTQAKNAGVDVLVETCPHYLSLTDDILKTAGSLAKCAPPLRDSATVHALREKVREREIDTIGSDHSPCLKSMKQGIHFFETWGGISSLQHAGPITYSLLHQQMEIPLSSVTALTSGNPAKNFNIKSKGSLSVGMDADFCLADFKNETPITRESLFYKNPQSPYLGITLPFRIFQTWIRGHRVFNHGKVVPTCRGKLLRPEIP